MKGKSQGMMIVLALVLAGVGLYLVTRLIAQKEQEAVQKAVTALPSAGGQASYELVTVVFAKQDIPAQKEIIPDMIETRQVPKTPSVPDDAIVSIEETAAQYSRLDMSAGDILRRSKITTKDQALGLNFRIPRGLRAVSIMVTEASSVGFQINRGDTVDMMALYSLDDSSGKPSKMVSTVLQNLDVLDATMDPRAVETKRAGSPLITFAVTPEQAEIIALVGYACDQTYLALRPVDDKARVEAKPRAISEIIGTGGNPEDDKAEKVEENKPSKPRIKIMGPGGSSQELELNGGGGLVR